MWVVLRGEAGGERKWGYKWILERGKRDAEAASIGHREIAVGWSWFMKAVECLSGEESITKGTAAGRRKIVLYVKGLPLTGVV